MNNWTHTNDEQIYVEDNLSIPEFPWLPLPKFLTKGDHFMIYKELTDLQLVNIMKNCLVRIDRWGFFLYCKSIDQESLTILDLNFVEDVEYCNCSEYTSSNFKSGFLRIQANYKALAKFGVNHSKFISNNMENEISITLILVNESPTVMESWGNVLIEIIFQHYNLRINIAPLDLLWKQYTYLIIYHSNINRNQYDQNKDQILYECCVRAAFGINQSKEEIHNFHYKPHHHYHQKFNNNLLEFQLRNFTFNQFFQLFMQYWPRADVMDIYNKFADSNGYFHHEGINLFLTNSLSQFSDTNSPKFQNTGASYEKQKTNRHLKLINWEKAQMTRTISGCVLPDEENEHLNSISVIKRSQSYNTSQKCRLNVEMNDTSCRHRKTNRTTHSEIRLCAKNGLLIDNEEFCQLIQQYEPNLNARNKNCFTIEGFYRFILSSTYQNICRTAYGIKDNLSGLNDMQHPLAHYYIDCVYLTNHCEQIYSNKLTSKKSNQIDSIKYSLLAKRFIRQTILSGIRALILECIHLTIDDTEIQSTNADETIVIATNFTNISTWFSSFKHSGSNSLQIMRKRFQYVLLKSVLDILNKLAFLVSDYPFLLFLHVHNFNQEQQSRLAALLQEYLGRWILIPPLPKFESCGQNITHNQRKFNRRQPEWPQHFPSPETMRNKILISIRLINSDISNPETYNSCENLCEKNFKEELYKNLPELPKICLPLSVFVTDPEGEEKTASPDIGSTNSSAQISPYAIRREISADIHNSTVVSKSIPYSKNQFKSTVSLNISGLPNRPSNNVLTTDDNPHLHPRLSRLMALPPPDYPPDATITLCKQYSEEDVKRFKTIQSPQSNGNTIQSVNNIINLETTANHFEEFNSNFQKQKSPNQMSESELLTRLSRIITIRKAQLQHQTKKERLLRHLVTEAYGSKRVSLSSSIPRQETSKPQSVININKNLPKKDVSKEECYKPIKSSNPKNKSTISKSKQLRNWFAKSGTILPKENDSDENRKESFLSATVKCAARRLSNASVQKFSRSFNSSNTNLDYSINLENNSGIQKVTDRSCQRSSDLSNKSKQNLITSEIDSSHISLEKGQSKEEVSSGNLKSKSKDITKLSTTSLHRSSKPKTHCSTKKKFKNLTDTCSRKSRNSSCGHCSCSSGSRSEQSSPVLNRSESKNLNYFRNTDNLDTQEIAQPITSNISISNKSESSLSETDSYSNTESEHSNSGCVSSPYADTSFSSNSSSENSMLKFQHRNPKPTLRNVTNRNNQSTVVNLIQNLNREPLMSFPQIIPRELKDLHKCSMAPSTNNRISKQDLWLNSLKWVLKPKVTYILHEELINILASKIRTKSLAEFNKHRLSCLYIPEKNQTEELINIAQSIGCQLIPRELDLDKLMTSTQKQSVRNQLSGIKSIHSTDSNDNVNIRWSPIYGYSLKPALLRIPTINRFHRLHGAKRKSRQLKINQLSKSPNKNLEPPISCICCFDPLDRDNEREIIARMPGVLTVGCGFLTSATNLNVTLPWNISIQLIKFPEFTNLYDIVGPLVGRNLESDKHESRVRTRKLPRRYHKALNSISYFHKSPNESRTSSVQNKLNDKFTKCDSNYFLNTGTEEILKADHESFKHNVNETHYSNESDSTFIQVELKSTKTNLSDLNSNDKINLQNLLEKQFPLKFRLFPKTSINISFKNSNNISRSQTLESVYNLENSLNLTHLNLESNLQTMTRSNSEIFIDSSHQQTAHFNRIFLPEITKVNLLAVRKINKVNYMSDDLKHIYAAYLLSTNSPLNKSLTGYHHFRLEYSQNQVTNIFDEHSLITPTTENDHILFHTILINNIGILLFCKMNINVYGPQSFGDLIETLSKQYQVRNPNLSYPQILAHLNSNVTRSKSVMNF